MANFKVKISGPRDEAVQTVNITNNESDSKEVTALAALVTEVRQRIADSSKLAADDRERLEKEIEKIRLLEGDDTAGPIMARAASAIEAVLTGAGAGGALMAAAKRLATMLGQ